MNLPPLPPLPEPRLWYDPETGRASAMVPLRPTYESLFDDFDIRTYAEQYGRLCAEAERDRLQARVAELEADAERLTDEGAEDIRALADRLLGRTASFPDMRQAALLLQDMYLEHRTASRKAKL